MQITYGKGFENLAPAAMNNPAKVNFRQKILQAQHEMQSMIAEGIAVDASQDCTLKHHYTPVHEEYGCTNYAREIFLPKGSIVIGKIHRHEHLNFIMQGRVTVTTEHGKKTIEAPAVFVSEVGLKRAVHAEEDTIWVTVHMTKHAGEAQLDKAEDELIAPSYEDMGLIGDLTEKVMLWHG